MLWNVVPTHPGTASSNRPPSAAEASAGLSFVGTLATGRLVVPVGRLAERALGIPGSRHPSHGSGKDFRDGLVESLRGQL